jgi:hypothetical protein
MEYIPIFRFGATEVRILQKIPHRDIFPLLEIVNIKRLKSITKVKSRFHKGTMVELPLYLGQSRNKHFGNVLSILTDLEGSSRADKQVNFYKIHKDLIDIPVISTDNDNIVNYSTLPESFNSIKDDYKKIAIRIFITALELSSQNTNHLKKLMGIIRENDIVLLDIVHINNAEAAIMKNIELIKALIPETNLKNTMVLNAFDVSSQHVDIHHFAPLINKKFNLGGFGDFATIPRDEGAGGIGTTAIIRYFFPRDLNLIHFVNTSFRRAKTELEASTYWAALMGNGHYDKCDACKKIHTSHTESKTEWKIFRIWHHIACIFTDVIPNYDRHSNPQDFDIDGWDIISKKTGNKM